MNEKVVWVHESHFCLLHFLPECRTECFTNQLHLIHMSIWEQAKGKCLESGGSLKKKKKNKKERKPCPGDCTKLLSDSANQKHMASYWCKE